MQIERGSCDNNFWQARPGAVRNRAQRLGIGVRQVGGLAQKTTAIGCWPATEADRVRSISQALKPVPPVTRETLRSAIRCVLVQERRERTKRILTARQFIDQRRVNSRQPPLK